MDSATQEINILKEKLQQFSLPNKLQEKLTVRLGQLSKLTNSPVFLPEFDRISKYIDWVTALPWEKRTEDKLSLESTERVLNKNHHGLDEIKERVLEYVSVMKLKEERGETRDIYRAPILCFVGLVGTGKTTIASSIAESLGRKFARIPFGGMGSPLDLRGQSRMHAEAEPGKIVKALVSVKTKNPVILLDEIDRVTDAGRSSIMGVLVELLDPEQNNTYIDHYIDYPIDLSEVLFIATANNTTSISTAVLDRIEPLSMPSYTDQEKIVIGKDYMLPQILKEAGVDPEVITIEDDAWAKVVRPLGFDAGIRTLERTIKGIVRKISKLIVENKGQNFVINSENVGKYLPR